MERIPLYPTPPKALIETIAPSELDFNCGRCALAAGRKTVVTAEGEAGGLLVVGQGPGRHEDAEGRPNIGKSGQYLRDQLMHRWRGKVVMDNAYRCFGAGEPPADAVAKCRPFLAQTLKEAKPTRVLALGDRAIQSLLGRNVPPLRTRRGYAWLYNDGKPIPIFFLIHPAAGERNRFLRRYFEEDLEWALTAQLPPPPWSAEAKVVATREDAEEAVEDLLSTDWFSFDVEASGQLFNRDYRILCASFAALGRETVWMLEEETLKNREVFEPFRRILTDPDVAKGGSGVKYDENAFAWALDCVVKGIVFDVRLQRKLLEPEGSGYLDDMAELVGMGGHKQEARAQIDEIVKGLNRARAKARARSETEKTQTLMFATETLARLGYNPIPEGADAEAYAYGYLPRDVLLRYNGRDTLVTSKLSALKGIELSRKKPQRRIWEAVVLPAARAIRQVEAWGMPVDRGAVNLYAQYMDLQLGKLRATLKQWGDFSPSSDPQVADLLYNKLGLTSPWQTKGGKPTTEADALEQLRDKHPAVPVLLEHSRFETLRGRCDEWLRNIRDDGRIHTSINLDGARTGRASSSDPNLQSIVRPDPDHPETKMARDCFVAPPGTLFLMLDYKQIEYRMMGWLSGDEEMLKVIRSGVDFHLATAQLISRQMWGIEPGDVKKPHRSIAKTVNFAVGFGMTDETLADLLKCSVEEARKVRQAIYGAYKKLPLYIERCKEIARKDGVAWTYWEGEPARCRPMWRIADEDNYNRSKAENGAFNTAVQGSAAEFCTASLGKIVHAIVEEKLPAELVLPIHDALLFVVPKPFVREIAARAKHEMTSFKGCGDLLEVDIEVGERWGSLEHLEA
jgi:uracil-DNA glycosylase family 4